MQKSLCTAIWVFTRINKKIIIMIINHCLFSYVREKCEKCSTHRDDLFTMYAIAYFLLVSKTLGVDVAHMTLAMNKKKEKEKVIWKQREITINCNGDKQLLAETTWIYDSRYGSSIIIIRLWKFKYNIAKNNWKSENIIQNFIIII